LRIEAMTPRGKFMLASESERPVIFVSGGVGITPMIAMATHIVEEGAAPANLARSGSTAPATGVCTPSASTSKSLPASIRR
jgi:ferredoxin-NADP reductase